MKRLSVLSIIITVVAVAGIILLGGVKENVIAGSELEITDLKLHYQPNALFVAHSVAIKKGWFQEEGFKSVEKKTFTSGHYAGEALIGGEVHVWTPGNMPVISMRHNGVPVVVAGMMNYSYSEALMIRNDANVKTPEDLYKIRIGLAVGSTCSGIIEEIARHHGLDANKLKLVNLPPPEQVTSLKNNEIQGLICWPPTPYKVADIATYSFDSKKFSHTAVPIVFSEKFLKKNPNSAKAILKVLYRAQAFCEDPANKAEAIKIHSEISEQPVESIELMWMDYWDPAIPNGVINERFVEDFKVYTDFQERNGRIKNPVSVLDYTYTDFVKEIRPEYVKVDGKWKP